MNWAYRDNGLCLQVTADLRKSVHLFSYFSTDSTWEITSPSFNRGFIKRGSNNHKVLLKIILKKNKWMSDRCADSSCSQADGVGAAGWIVDGRAGGLRHCPLVPNLLPIVAAPESYNDVIVSGYSDGLLLEKGKDVYSLNLIIKFRPVWSSDLL